TIKYGLSVALENVSLEVNEGDIVTIIGANGAGKSTLLMSLLGLVPISSGEIYFKGKLLNNKKTNDIVKDGIVLVPENRQLFPFLNVLDNLTLGACLRKNKDEVKNNLENVFRLFPILKEKTKQKAGTLSGGQQQMLAVGRGLMANPTLLCLDEPSLGLAPLVIEEMGAVLKDINKHGVSILLVEQNVHLALGTATRGYALKTGNVIFGGTIEELKASDIAKEAYLGK
ncbi:MAG: ABC transporter ATP-binding protein, partial [Dehalococcoidales bacterium]|nr:ABC transporter ATP-binding protein [Dehalococcoidales bacterium]